ncbi:MAG: hypothetical protein IK065_02300 [Neisseriaceae bacterium]|nr:hypothetical protein [Neisseriaceae bacterium]
MSQQDSDVFDFFALIERLLKAWKTIAIFVLVGLCLGIFAAKTMPKYRTEAIVEIAQIGLENLEKKENNNLTSNFPLESVESVLVRSKNLYFVDKVVKRLINDGMIEEKEASKWRSKLLRVTRKNKDTDLINLVIFTKTDSQGREILSRFVEILADEQDDKYQKQVNLRKEKIKDLEEQQRILEEQYSQTHQNLINRNNTIDYMNLSRLNTEKMFIEIKQLIIANKQALMDPNTHKTRLLGDIYVSERPVEPKKSVLLLLGVIAGGIAGCLYVLFTISYRKFRQNKNETANS